MRRFAILFILTTGLFLGSLFGQVVWRVIAHPERPLMYGNFILDSYWFGLISAIACVTHLVPRIYEKQKVNIKSYLLRAAITAPVMTIHMNWNKKTWGFLEYKNLVITPVIASVVTASIFLIVYKQVSRKRFLLYILKRYKKMIGTP